MMDRSFLKRLKSSLVGCRFKIALRILLFPEDGYMVDLFGYLIPLPFLDRWIRDVEGMLDSWGFYFYELDALVLCWGDRTLHLHFPWSLRLTSWQVMRADGRWVEKAESWSKKIDDVQVDDQREVRDYPYVYRLRSGKIQERVATVYVERVVWKWRSLKWAPWPKKVVTSISVRFNDEVGEQSGSWKGGCIGCGYELRPGETAELCLKRMERERTF